MAVDVAALNAEVARLQAEAGRLRWRSYHVAVGLLALLAAMEVIGWHVSSRTTWGLALIQLGSASLGVSALGTTRPRLYMALMNLLIAAIIAMFLVFTWQLAKRFT